MSKPSITILPSVFFIIPKRHKMRDVLPLPDCPQMATCSYDLSDTAKPFSTGVEPGLSIPVSTRDIVLHRGVHTREMPPDLESPAVRHEANRLEQLPLLRCSPRDLQLGDVCATYCTGQRGKHYIELANTVRTPKQPRLDRRRAGPLMHSGREDGGDGSYLVVQPVETRPHFLEVMCSIITVQW